MKVRRRDTSPITVVVVGTVVVGTRAVVGTVVVGTAAGINSVLF